MEAKWNLVFAFILLTFVSWNEIDAQELYNLETEYEVEVFCAACTVGVNEILKLNDTEAITNKSIELCLTLGYGNEHFCNSIVYANADEIIYIVTNTPEENGQDICGFIFVSKGCVSNNPDRAWSLTLPDVPKPPLDTTPYPEVGVETMKILHLSDTHYDPHYVPGGEIYCEDVYLCCRKVNESSLRNNTAGFWGTYGPCDVPRWTLEALYDQISKTHTDIDLIIWTGDIVPHDVWETTREETLSILHEMSDLIIQYFPGVPVYPALGNHDSDLVNVFPQPYIDEPEFDVSWLYDEVSLIWQNWLPSEAASSVMYAGYYSVPVAKGLKLISINTNYHNSFNWWLLLDSSDIANQLGLLAQELQDLEDAGEFAYIIGHIPPGSGDCSLSWSHEFTRIVSRYEDTISGIFYGHTHNDKFQIFFSTEDLNRPCEVGYIGQSQTTYSDSNPGYKIYTVEAGFNGSRFRVLDHENWIFDLAVANALNESTITNLYSAKESYGLKDFSPETWLDFVIDMNVENSTLFDLYFRHNVKASPPRLIEGCDFGCQQSELCDLVISDNSDHSKCEFFIRNTTLY